jgi:hypothetical protein
MRRQKVGDELDIVLQQSGRSCCAGLAEPKRLGGLLGHRDRYGGPTGGRGSCHRFSPHLIRLAAIMSG